MKRRRKLERFTGLGLRETRDLRLQILQPFTFIAGVTAARRGSMLIFQHVEEVSQLHLSACASINDLIHIFRHPITSAVLIDDGNYSDFCFWSGGCGRQVSLSRSRGGRNCAIHVDHPTPRDSTAIDYRKGRSHLVRAVSERASDTAMFNLHSYYCKLRDCRSDRDIGLMCADSSGYCTYSQR